MDSYPIVYLSPTIKITGGTSKKGMNAFKVDRIKIQVYDLNLFKVLYLL